MPRGHSGGLRGCWREGARARGGGAGGRGGGGGGCSPLYIDRVALGGCRPACSKARGRGWSLLLALIVATVVMLLTTITLAFLLTGWPLS